MVAVAVVVTDNLDIVCSNNTDCTPLRCTLLSWVHFQMQLTQILSMISGSEKQLANILLIQSKLVIGQTCSRYYNQHLHDDGGQQAVRHYLFTVVFFFVVEYNSIFLLFTLFYNAVNDS